jgi:hypothetical protein
MAHRSARGSRRDADSDRFAALVRARFPSMPAREARRAARFACAGRTERVGVLSAGGALEEHAVELAVIAHARHRFTRYEALLARGVDRDEARALVRDEVSAWLRAWSAR